MWMCIRLKLFKIQIVKNKSHFMYQYMFFFSRVCMNVYMCSFFVLVLCVVCFMLECVTISLSVREVQKNVCLYVVFHASAVGTNELHEMGRITCTVVCCRVLERRKLCNALNETELKCIIL